MSRIDLYKHFDNLKIHGQAMGIVSVFEKQIMLIILKIMSLRHTLSNHHTGDIYNMIYQLRALRVAMYSRKA